MYGAVPLLLALSIGPLGSYVRALPLCYLSNDAFQSFRKGMILPWACRSQRDQGYHKKPTEITNLSHRNSESLNQQPGNLPGTDLGPLHICDSCKAGSTCRTSNNGSRGCPQALIGSSDLIPHTGLPWLDSIQWEVLRVIATWYAILCWYPWEACSFLN